MSLWGYKKKTNPAPWTTMPGHEPEVKPKKVYVLKRTPLKRSTTPINRRSAVQSKRENKYNYLVGIWKKQPENAFCCFPGCRQPTEDCHHTRGKLKQLLFDSRWWSPVCRTHHTWIDAHRDEARNIVVFPGTDRAMPLLPAYGTYNSQPNETVTNSHIELQSSASAEV